MAEIQKAQFSAELDIPVSVTGDSSSYILGKGRLNIVGDDVTITIKSRGRDGLMLSEFLMGGEVAVLSFAFHPVQPRNQ